MILDDNGYNSFTVYSDEFDVHPDWDYINYDLI